MLPISSHMVGERVISFNLSRSSQPRFQPIPLPFGHVLISLHTHGSAQRMFAEDDNLPFCLRQQTLTGFTLTSCVSQPTATSPGDLIHDALKGGHEEMWKMSKIKNNNNNRSAGSRSPSYKLNVSFFPALDVATRFFMLHPL